MERSAAPGSSPPGTTHMADAWEDLVGRRSTRSAPRLARRSFDGPASTRARAWSSSVAANGPGETHGARASTHRLIGVDLSAEQLARARASVPGATFVLRRHLRRSSSTPDRSTLWQPSTCLTTCRASCSPSVLGRIHGWLRPGGLLPRDASAPTAPRAGKAGGSACRCSSRASCPPRTRRIVGTWAASSSLRDEVVDDRRARGRRGVSVGARRAAAMSCDFSLAHYRELLARRGPAATARPGSTAPPVAGDLILRHDVDLSLDAGAGGRRGRGRGGRVVDVVPDDAVGLLQPRLARGRARGCAAAVLGGRIAHHAVWPDVDLDARFDPVVAWHNPDPEYMRAPIAGAVNVMTAPWFDPDHYRSDSNAHWRHGCPHERAGARRVRVAAAADASGDLGLRRRDDGRDDGVVARRRPRGAARAAARGSDRPVVSLVLNGAPRSGKSSIVAAVQKTFEGSWMKLGVDIARNDHAAAVFNRGSDCVRGSRIIPQRRSCPCSTRRSGNRWPPMRASDSRSSSMSGSTTETSSPTRRAGCAASTSSSSACAAQST